MRNWGKKLLQLSLLLFLASLGSCGMSIYQTSQLSGAEQAARISEGLDGLGWLSMLAFFTAVPLLTIGGIMYLGDKK